MHSEDSYFVSWTVTDENGNDVTSYVLGDQMASPYVTFTMPMAGSSVDGYTWSDDYTLYFIENSSSKETSLVISGLAAPVEGEPLDDTAVISFENGAEDDSYPVTWSYRAEDGRTVIPSEIAFQETAYTASIYIPRESSKLQVFSSQDKLTATLEDNPDITVSTRKNDSDGSVILTIDFDKTGSTAGQPQEEAPVKLTIEARDLSTDMPMRDIDPSWEDAVYYVSPSSKIALTTPHVDDEGFVGWLMEGDDIWLQQGYSPTDKTIVLGIEPDVTDICISPGYIPVVHSINATMPDPVVGEELPTDASMIVSITKDHEVHPDNLVVTWSPSDAVANAMTQYTATIRVVPNEDGDILVRLAGTDMDYRTSNLSFIFFPESFIAQVNGEDAPHDTDQFIMTKTFAPIQHSLKGVKQPESVPSLSNAKNTEEDVRASLPATTMITLSDGSDIASDIQWNVVERVSDNDPRYGSTWDAEGTIVLPDSVHNPDNLSLDISMKVDVKEMETVSPLSASLASGTFLSNQSTTLHTDTEGAEIYYTIDGSDPSENGVLYQGEEIDIARETLGHDKLTIRAIAVKDGMLTSGEAVYIYDFTYTLSIPVPTDSVFNTLSQIGVPSGAFYSLTPASEGVSIDDRGNAIATKAGTYQVIAKADEGFAWKTEDGETSEYQVIEFVIAPLDITDIAQINANDYYDSLEAIEKDIKVMIEDFELPSDSYTVSLSQDGDLVTITVTGNDSCTGTLTTTTSVSPAETAVLTFDSNGGVFPDGKDKMTITCKIGETITIPEAPQRQGYAFQYWKGSSYKPGDSYKVTGNHTFTAVWKKSKDAAPDTSDNTHIPTYALLFICSALLSLLLGRNVMRQKQ